MFISYAQAKEDVLLHRALHHVHHDNGCYIDVGAYHPTNDSVTRHFYDHGWRGINIEPARHLFSQFQLERPDEINLQVAISDQPGELTFYDLDGQLNTLEKEVADRHAAKGMAVSAYTVPTMTLTQVCDQYVRGNIHFLKIDVEGHEAAALRGMDFRKYRPWVLVIEATEPMELDKPTHGEWEELVLRSGYTHVHTHLPNRYYVAHEHPSLIPHFAVRPDEFSSAGLLWERDEARREAAALRQELNELRSRMPSIL
jgi:FkbM family methyltransferase